jgi:excisionase family DNA binding protein
MSDIILTTPNELRALIQTSIREAISESSTEKNRPLKEILTISEASEYLNLAKQTLYGFTSKNEIPFLKRGKKLYFQKGDLDRWLQAGRKLTKDEIESNTIQPVKRQDTLEKSKYLKRKKGGFHA